jgi:hypothetical protein
MKKKTKPQKIFSVKERKRIKIMAGLGLRDEDIAQVFEVAESTLKKYCAYELKVGHKFAIGNLCVRAYDKAMEGNTTMLCFLLKAKGGFREVHPENDNEENNQPEFDLTKLSKDERSAFKTLLKKASIINAA